jgi:hypothetical protein
MTFAAFKLEPTARMLQTGDWQRQKPVRLKHQAISSPADEALTDSYPDWEGCDLSAKPAPMTTKAPNPHPRRTRGLGPCEVAPVSTFVAHACADFFLAAISFSDFATTPLPSSALSASMSWKLADRFSYAMPYNENARWVHETREFTRSLPLWRDRAFRF